jgi:transposase-like protein
MIDVKELYELLEDCHNALAKATINDNLYNKMSKKIIDMKKLLVKQSMMGDNECPSCQSSDRENILTYKKSCNDCGFEWTNKEKK